MCKILLVLCVQVSSTNDVNSLSIFRLQQWFQNGKQNNSCMTNNNLPNFQQIRHTDVISTLKAHFQQIIQVRAQYQQSTAPNNIKLPQLLVFPRFQCSDLQLSRKNLKRSIKFYKIISGYKLVILKVLLRLQYWFE